MMNWLNRLPSSPWRTHYKYLRPPPLPSPITHHRGKRHRAAAGAYQEINKPAAKNAGRRRLREACFPGVSHRIHHQADLFQAHPPASPPQRRPRSTPVVPLRAAPVPPGAVLGGVVPRRARHGAPCRHRGRRAAGGDGGDREERQDRGLLRDVVGAERDLQHLQQEGAQRVPLPVAHVAALPRRRLRHHARVLGHQDRRRATDGPRFLEGPVSGGDCAHHRARGGDGEHGEGGRVLHAHHQERGAGLQRARLQVLPWRPLPAVRLLVPPSHHRWMRSRRRYRDQFQHDWIHGRNDLEPGVRVPEHILQEGDEGQVGERDELLRLPLHALPGDPPPFRLRHGGPQGVGCRLAECSRRDRSKLRLVGGRTERVLPPVQPSVLHVAGRDLAADVQRRQHHEAHLRHRRLHHHLPHAGAAHQRARGGHRHPRNLHLLPGKTVTGTVSLSPRVGSAFGDHMSLSIVSN